MRAILPLPAGGFGLQDVPPPGLAPGEALVEMRVCGLCGTDLAKLARPGETAGVRLGHELAGVVRAVGPGARTVAPGDRVTAAHHVPCGSCQACRHGNESMCAQFKATAIDPCGFAELVRFSRLHTEQVMFRLPEGMSFEAASFTEPLACAVRAVERSRVQPGDRLLVVGGGSMGLLIAQAVRARGATPIIADIREERLLLARALGIPATTGPLREPRPEGATFCAGGLDGAILTVVNQTLLSDVQRLLAPGGRLNIFAGPTGGSRLSLDFDDLYHRELTLFATYSSTPATLAEAFRLLADGIVRVEPLISHRLPLTAFAEGVRLQREGRAVKVLFHP
jgi:L-iditol 2-dehydrogenase